MHKKYIRSSKDVEVIREERFVGAVCYMCVLRGQVAGLRHVVLNALFELEASSHDYSIDLVRINSKLLLATG